MRPKWILAIKMKYIAKEIRLTRKSEAKTFPHRNFGREYFRSYAQLRGSELLYIKRNHTSLTKINI